MVIKARHSSGSPFGQSFRYLIASNSYRIEIRLWVGHSSFVPVHLQPLIAEGRSLSSCPFFHIHTFHEELRACNYCNEWAYADTFLVSSGQVTFVCSSGPLSKALLKRLLDVHCSVEHYVQYAAVCAVWHYLLEPAEVLVFIPQNLYLPANTCVLYCNTLYMKKVCEAF